VQLALIGSTYPLGRTGKADEVASAVAFLADNDESGWITGHLLTIDGGSTLTNGSKHVMDAALKAAQGK
jgi:NAD(P)-dependent dehydrogenase (short-subunit alcohol dehydrogenase family)